MVNLTLYSVWTASIRVYDLICEFYSLQSYNECIHCNCEGTDTVSSFHTAHLLNSSISKFTLKLHMSLSRYALIHLPLPLSILVFLQISQTVCLALVSALVCTFPAVALCLLKKVLSILFLPVSGFMSNGTTSQSHKHFVSISSWHHQQCQT